LPHPSVRDDSVEEAVANLRDALERHVADEPAPAVHDVITASIEVHVA
jgi:hypothetical protein